MSASVPQFEWSLFESEYQRLAAQTLDASNVDAWAQAWSDLTARVSEIEQRLYVLTSVNTADDDAEKALHRFLEEVYPNRRAEDQRLREKLLASGCAPKSFEVPLRNLQSEAELFREDVLPLEAEEQRLGMEFDQIVGAQTVMWEGEQATLAKVATELDNPDRTIRQLAFEAIAARKLQDREKIGDLWKRFLDNRLAQARAAGFGNDYRAYRWRRMLRFDYTPDDCKSFQDAIEAEVVPAAQRIVDRRKQLLGLESLRPWDMDVDPTGRTPLKPFADTERLSLDCSTVFHRVSPVFGGYYDRMRRENLLDLPNRQNKAPGGYCTTFNDQRVAFIFMNAVGQHRDVQTLLHEGGHAFHAFEAFQLPLLHQMDVPMEFAEVASMGMEFLASRYLEASEGGFYTASDAARARIEHIEECILFWPYMAVVDSFQHWVYENPELAHDSEACDEAWATRAARFLPMLDWSGWEQYNRIGWQLKLHIHQVPFYYVEYGMAQLGAVQVYSNSMKDYGSAVERYRTALAAGGTRTLPELFEAAGARFAFDRQTVREAVAVLERDLERLRPLDA